MTSLIAELRQEHRELLRELQQIEELGPSSDDGKTRLGALGERLLEHLNKEDLRLYPRLMVAATKDPELEKLVDFMAVEIRHLRDVATRFFNVKLHSSRDFEIVEAFADLREQTVRRIEREERELLAVYERVLDDGSKPSAVS